MVAYKLYYFDGRGSAEILRLIFAFGGAEYEDVRFAIQDWPNHKDEMPFGKIPVLEVDGVKLPQSFAMARYLARKFGYRAGKVGIATYCVYIVGEQKISKLKRNKLGLVGNDDWESAQVDALADQYKDFLKEIQTYISVFFWAVPGEKDELYKDVFLRAVHKNLPFYETSAAASDSGFLVGDSVTWVDLLVAEFLANFISDEVLNTYPKLKALQNKVHDIPSTKKWRETRPDTAF